MIENSIEKLGSQLATACINAIQDISATYKDEQLYAIGLFTNDALHAVSLIANTEEQLKGTVKRYNETVDEKYGITSTLNGMRWSYGDWGIHDVGSEYFNGINETLYEIGNQLDEMDDDEADVHFSRLWDTVIESFATINDSTVIANNHRENVTILLCGDFPDELIDDCARKFNPSVVADKYVSWVADA